MVKRAAAMRNAKMVQLPRLYIGESLLGKRNGDDIPPQLAMAIIPPVASAVAVEPCTVAVRYYSAHAVSFQQSRRIGFLYAQVDVSP